MSNKTHGAQGKIDSFMREVNTKSALVDEIMMLAESVVERRPDLIDELVDQIIPNGWKPTKAS